MMGFGQATVQLRKQLWLNAGRSRQALPVDVQGSFRNARLG